jgi:hypothetical protein
MINQIFTGTPTAYRFAKCPTSVVAGQPVLLGTIPAVALTSYSSLTGGAVFYFNGTFALTVVGESVVSPQTTHKINPGDDLFASGGTLDATTNVTTGFTITAVSTDPKFGKLDPNYVAVAAGATDTQAFVQLVVGG